MSMCTSSWKMMVLHRALYSSQNYRHTEFSASVRLLHAPTDTPDSSTCTLHDVSIGSMLPSLEKMTKVEGH